LKTSWFNRFAVKQNIPDSVLRNAVERASAGLIDTDLGGGLILQRIARSGEGRRGGFRAIVLFRLEERAFFVFGFAKNERDNITKSEADGFRKLRSLLDLTDKQLNLMIQEEKFMEVCDND
jgi:hypothetical protein